MINMFRKDENGKYETAEGVRYDCIVINNDTAVILKYKKVRWRPTLAAALKLKDAAVAPAEKDTAIAEVT